MQSKGMCSFCGKLFSKRGLLGHLPACKERQQAIEKADAGTGKTEQLLHLRAENPYLKTFWLDLEINASDPMETLDRYLRAIWLECCGHMSQFSYGKRMSSDEIDMDAPVGRAFSRGKTISHFYDFGSTTQTLINALGVREGKPTTNRSITLMARNELLIHPCAECGEPGTYVCNDCAYDGPEDGWLCCNHAKEHARRYNEHWVLEAVNSPRMGLCGYTGPATSPY